MAFCSCELCARCFFLLLASLTCFVLLRGYEYLLVDVQHDSNLCPRVETHAVYTLQNVYNVKDGHSTNHLHKWSFKYKLYRYFDKNYISVNHTRLIQPVLFIPGSQGWYENVQSIGTVIQKYQNESNDYFYDVYTTDLGEELTAFSGLRLEKQGKYVCDVVINLLEVYGKAKSVLILAHSMGGVVARVASISEYCNDTVIPLIFTLASPHYQSPVTWDYAQIQLYARLNNIYYTPTHPNNSIQLMKRHTFYYNKYAKLRLDTFADYFPKNYMKEYEKVGNITLIAITGGQTDLVVDPPTEIIDGILPPKNGFSVMTSYIPGVDRTIDHHGIVYCNKWIDKLREALFTIYDNESHSLYDDRYENVDRLADILLPPENEYNKLYHDMLEGFTTVVQEKLSFLFYLARISLNYTPSSNASAVMVYLIITYYTLLVKNSKSSEWSFCYYINPVLHYKSIKSTFVFKYVIVITTIFQTIKWMLTGVGITAAPNIFSILILYTGGISFITAEYMVCYVLLLIGSVFYNIFLYIRQFFNRNPISYRVYEIFIITSVLTMFDIIIYYPTCLIGLYKINDILKLLIVFLKRCIVCFEILCLIACRFEVCGNLDCVLTLSAAVRLALFFEQMSIYTEENVFLYSPPGKFDWSEMGIYFYSLAVEIPIGILFFWLYKLSMMKYSYRYSKLEEDEEEYDFNVDDYEDIYFNNDDSDSDFDDGISLTTFSRNQSRNGVLRNSSNRQNDSSRNLVVVPKIERTIIPISTIPIQIVTEEEMEKEKENQKNEEKNEENDNINGLNPDDINPLPTISEFNNCDNNVDNNEKVYSRKNRNIPLLSSSLKHSANNYSLSSSITSPTTSLRSLLSSVNRDSLSHVSLKIASPFPSFRHINENVTNKGIQQLKARLSSYKTYIQIYSEWIMFILYFTLVKANFFVVIVFGLWIWGIVVILHFNHQFIMNKNRNVGLFNKTKTAAESIQTIPI